MRVLVINPNSNSRITHAIDGSLDSVCGEGDCIECVGLDDAPYGIETDEHIATAAALVAARIEKDASLYDAFVVACYSDPGVERCRQLTGKPVLGIQESAAGLAAAHGKRFGVVALSRESIERHIAYIRDIGLHEFHAGERPLGISVEQSAAPETLERIIQAGNELVEEDGAEMVVLGCAGMIAHRDAAQRALGVPVIDPVLAAVDTARRLLT